MGITDPSQTARILLAWESPQKAKLAGAMNPGLKIEATLMMNNKMLSQTVFLIGDEKFQDVAMIMEEAPR